MSGSLRAMRGFSLVELMIVLIVAGILVAITVPTIVGFQHSAQLSGTANTLASDMRYARSLASSQGTTYQITFAPTSYAVARVSPLTPVRTRALPRGIKCTVSNNASFYPWGLAAATTVTLADTASQTVKQPQVVRLYSNGSIARD